MLFLSSVALAIAITPVAPAPTRDPVTNGMKIGAVVGAVAGFLVSLNDCVYRNLLSTHSDNCDGQILLGLAVGAGVGAAIGAGIDVLIDRSPFVDPAHGGRSAPRLVVRWHLRL